MRIYIEQGRLFGKIEKSLDPAEEKGQCEKCGGDRKNRPIVGLVILRSMEKRGDEYAGGDILDPDTGIVYRCRLKLADEGKKLLVRGFVGVPLLGRSQVWVREQ